MKTYQPIDLDFLLQELKKPKKTLILFHRNPDPDAVGSAFALRRMLGELGSEAYCVCGDELPARLRFLAEGEQESVLPSSIPVGFSPERILSVDVAAPEQLGSLQADYEDRVDYMIDHHGRGTPFADYFIDSKASATGEILFALYAMTDPDRWSQSICRALYAAISGDTGCFRFSNATPHTHRAAAKLLESGIDAAGINHLLFESKSPAQIRAEGAGSANLQLYANGKIAVIPFSYAQKSALHLNDDDLNTLIDVARSVEGVLLALTVRQPTEAAEFRVSLRAACSYDVSALAAEFGGGGHPRAAGCTVKAPDLDAAIQAILEKIDISRLF